MTIKKQFTLLAAAIISIPLLCVIYFVSNYYVHSQERMLIKGFKEIRNHKTQPFSEDEYAELEKLISNLPKDIETAILTENFKVLISNMPGIKANANFSQHDLWFQIDKTAKQYFYQFTAAPIKNHKYMILTRVPREKKAMGTRNHFMLSLTIFLFIIVSFLLIYVVLIFLSISKSITTLKNHTQEISEGHLNEDLSSGYRKFPTNEITSITEHIDKMRISLVEAQNAKNKFVMGMSHDLRTPVAVIKGYTEALCDEIITEPEEIDQTLHLVLNKTNQLQGMINTLIDFMKLDSNEIRNNLCPNSITEFITAFAKETEIANEVFKRKFISEIDFPHNIMVPFDPQLATRAFENLITNAIRYTKDGDIIKIIAFQNEKEIILKIEDTGCGIDKKDLNNIFDLFYRGTNSRREEGMGVGLSVVKNIITTHGWNIDVTSEINKGTTFIITIPFES